MLRVLVAAGLMTMAAAPAPSVWLSDRTADMHDVQGPYSNPNYGFSVVPPNGLRAFVADDPTTDRGVLIVLGEGRTIVAFADDADPDFSSDRLCRHVFGQQRTGARLHGMGVMGERPACSVTLTDGQSFEQVLQRLGDGRAGKILFGLWLTTTAHDKAADLAAFHAVAASFKRVPIAP